MNLNENILLSVVIPIRNRSGDRLDNCLRSLRWQDHIDPHVVEVIIVDFGSDKEHTVAIERSAKQFEARIVHVNIEGLWNRSRALNYGVRAAQGKYIFCTDVDMIFAPNFLSSMMTIHQQMPQKYIVFSKCQDLPASVSLQAYHKEEYPTLFQQSTQRATQGTGACQSAHRQFFFDARGYDEAFQHWGAEDDDMRSRAIRYGLTPHWISPQTSMLHQWHPTTKNQRPWRKRWNQARLYLTRWKIKKNPKQWGGAP